jgi:MarR family transcriptional regulator, organic hydroperoxide resistance regulator
LKVKKAANPKSDLAASLPEFMCFAVYSTNLAFGKAYKSLFDELGLTYTQYALLVALHAESGQTVSKLGEQMFLASNTLTPLLKRLEAMGYVTRERDAEDERQVRVSLTSQGRALFERAFAGRESVIKATGLDPEAFVRLQRDLIRLRDNLLAASTNQPEKPNP